MPTAVGKVRDNEALSQPFRTAPRHRHKETKEVKEARDAKDVKESKEGKVREVLIVPVKQPVKKLDIVTENNNNNTGTVVDRNTLRKTSSRSPVPRELPQEEANRAFANTLAQAKQKLRSSGPVEEEGAPPPPPRPVHPSPPPPPVAPLAPLARPPAPPKWERRVSSLPKGPTVNPRDELMEAIRAKAGQPGRSVAV